MVELNKKYKIGVRRFSFINWIGFYSLYKKETLRFLIVSGQTILGPVVTAILFLMVISLAIGESRGVVLGVPFIEFLAPGLISMQIIQQSFAHSSSSILSGKMMGNIVDLVGSPLSALEVTLAVIFASITRSIMISFLNPFFHMIDGLRFSFIGSRDGSIKFGLIYLFLFSLIIWFISFLLYKKGYKIRN